MVTVEVFFKAAAAAVSALLAALLLMTPRAQRPARYLGVFLSLIALNQGAEAMRAAASEPGEQLMWFKVASIAASLDPAALAFFAWSLFMPERPPRMTHVLLAGIPGALLALAAGWIVSEVPQAPFAPASQVFPTLLTFYTAIVYGVAFFQAARKLETAPLLRWELLLAGLSLALFPMAGRPFDTPGYFIFGRAAVEVTTLLAAVAFPIALAVYTLRHFPHARASRVVLIGFALAIAIQIIARTPSALQIASWRGGLDLAPPTEVLGRASAAVRWALFGVFTSVALFRDDAFGFSLAARRRAARALIGTAFALVAMAILFFGGSGTFLGVSEAFVLAVAVALSQSFRVLIDKVALLFYGVPAPGDSAAAHALYRRAAASALARGRLPDRDPEIQRLREELDIDVPTAQLIERLAQESMQGALVPGEVVLGRYRVDQAVGRGSGGRALLAEDLVLGRKVVLKEILDQTASALREARVVGTLQHPNVVTLHDVLRRGSGFVLVTEYVAGGSLAGQLARAPFPRASQRDFALGFLDGLATVHAAGVIHGDIKPSNVLLDDDLRPKVSDFGLARNASTVGANEGEGFGGTLAYMAPEQRAGAPPTPQSDIYAAGLVLRETLSDAGPATRSVIARALDVVPERRWASVGEMRGALAAALDEPRHAIHEPLHRDLAG